MKVDPDTAFPDLQVAPYTEWDNFKGQRKADGKRHGIVRETQPGRIYESSYKDDKLHGLRMEWGDDRYPKADILQNDS